MTKEDKPRENWIFGIVGIIILLLSTYFLIMYFSNISIGSWIAKENYTDKGEWLKQIGLFLGSMAGIYMIIEAGTDLLEYLPSRKKEADNQ